MERRLVVRMLHYWRSLVPEGHSRPGIDRVNPETFADAWDWSFVLDLKASTIDPVLNFAGEGFLDDVDAKCIGDPLSEIDPDSLLRHATRDFPKAISRAIPLTSGGEIISSTGVQTLFRSIMLPMDDESGRFSFLFGATSFRRNPV
jgi:hypothetical protein